MTQEITTFVVWAISLSLTRLAMPASTQKANLADGILPGGNLLACETYSLRALFSSGQLDLLSFPAKMKELGIKGIAINDWYLKGLDRAYLDQVKAAARQEGRVIVALIMGGNLASPDEKARQRSIEAVKNRLLVADYLGARVVRVDTGGVGSGEDPATVGVERVIASIRELLPLLKELNIKFTLENHGGVSASSDNLLRIIRGTDPRWVGSCLDFKNWPAGKWHEECEAMAPFAYHVHAKSHSFKEDGEETDVSYERILAALRKAKYPRAISIEFEGGGDPVEGVRKTRELLVRYWK